MKIKLFLISLTLAAPLFADDTVKMSAYVVTDSSTGELTTPEPTGNSVFEDFSSLLNTPRAVSTLSPQLLQDLNISNIGQLANFTSNVQNPGSYGHTATINVRGDLSEQYLNGQRLSDNAFGFSPSLNNVEQIDIVHGAAPIVFGPGYYNGGYENFITKTARNFNQTNVNITLGYLASSHSYLDTSLQIDVNKPINSSSAIRISYEVTKDNTFYVSGRNDIEDLFITYHKDFANANLDFSSEIEWEAAPQIEGVNRPTQELIWHDLYLTGSSDPLDSASIPNGKLEKLRWNDALISPSDFSNADVYTNQLIYTNKLDDISTIKSYTLSQYVNRRRFNEFAYSEYSRQYTADEKLELHSDYLFLYQILGVETRFEYRESETNWENAFFNGFDIHNSLNHNAATFPQDYSLGVPGLNNQLFFGPLEGNADTTDSKVYQLAPYLQHRVKLDNLQILYGGRIDAYRALVSDPLEHSVSDNLTTYSASYMGSIIYSFNNDLSCYLSYAHLRAVNSTVSGGGIVLDPNLKINRDDFESLNRLYELGLRYQINKSSLSATAFLQYRQQHDFYYDDADDIKSRGLELEYKYELNHLYFLINTDYMENNFVNSLPFEFSGIGLNAASETGNYRLPGLSRLSANSTIGYKLAHFGATLSGRIQSPQTGDVLGSYHIPSEYWIDAQISYYFSKTVYLTISGYNLTNRINWIHNGDDYSDNVEIVKDLPIHANLSFHVSL